MTLTTEAVRQIPNLLTTSDPRERFLGWYQLARSIPDLGIDQYGRLNWETMWEQINHLIPDPKMSRAVFEACRPCEDFYTQRLNHPVLGPLLESKCLGDGLRGGRNAAFAACRALPSSDYSRSLYRSLRRVLG